jgi:hypothetical protein
MNGNIFKGNKPKKGGRGKKEMYAEFNENTDQYGKIVSKQGGKHMSVLLLNDPSKTPVHATIRGIHHKRVYMNVDDFVIVRGNGNLYEIWGKVPDSDVSRVRRDFVMAEGDDSNKNFIFQRKNEMLLDDDDIDDDNEKEHKEKPKGSILVPKQPDRNYKLDKIDNNERIDIDSI